MRIVKLAAVLVLWALSFILNEVALRSLQPMTVAAGRWSVTAALVLLLLVQRRHLGAFGAALRVDWRAFFVLSLFGVTLLYGLQVAGQARTSAVNTGLLANTVPVFTALLAAIFLRQRLRPVSWTGILLALVGAWVISTGGLRLQVQRATALGDGLVLLSSLAAALYFVFGLSGPGGDCRRRHAGRADLAAPGDAGRPGQRLDRASPDRRAGPGYRTGPAGQPVVVGDGGVAGRDARSRLHLPDAVYIYLIPLLTMIFAVLLLGETVGPAQLAGAALLLGGVWLAERSRANE